jgi:hypothetical protein
MMKTVWMILMLVAVVTATPGPSCSAEKDSIDATKVKEFPLTVESAVFSTDGKMIAFSPKHTDKKEQAIGLYSADGKEVLTGKIESGNIYRMRFSEDGKQLHLQSLWHVHEFDTKTGKVTGTRKGEIPSGKLSLETKIGDSRLTAKIEEDYKEQTTHLSVTRDDKQLFRINVGGGKDMPVRFLRISPDGKKIALGYHYYGGNPDDRRREGSDLQEVDVDPYFTRSFVIIYDAISGKKLHTEHLWSEWLEDIHYGTDGMLLLTIRADGENPRRPTLWLLKK